ncbi:dihydroorotate dehydrogenase-like protein [Lentisphaerota bacterium ZTH]|nr:dihydroorotate dehydrogenase-like protein [Lentisphaerota bacterium]WET05749.1 dihydroorotate dehydrogenase-like protein [Lentisphaerota bacterium ZTH]
MDLSTTYMGVKLKNPLIAGACSLTGSAENAKKVENSGAGALVIKSLFEEQIQLERLRAYEDEFKYNDRQWEMLDIYPLATHEAEYAGTDEHLRLVNRICEDVKIPVFASLNAVNHDTWIEHACLLAKTGVQGLELNFYSTPKDIDKPGSDIEAEQIKTLAEIRRKVKIPIAVKLSPFYTNQLEIISQLDKSGADAFVLFNRLFQPKIDIRKEKHISPFNLSHEIDNRLPLRFTGLLHGNIRADICASTGIYQGDQIVEMILAGATAVQSVSSFYKNGLPHARIMLRDLENWMQSKNYKCLADFRGKLNKANSSNPWAYTRAQYAKLLLNPQEVIDNAPVV